MLVIPTNNTEIFQRLYLIEIGLRELIIEKSTEISGAKWYKKHLPPDLLDKYKAGLIAEKKISWTQLVPHHPIYYIDFPDLKKIIEVQHNWRDVFEKVFKRKEVITSELLKLEPIRNKIAHSRKVSDVDKNIVTTTYSVIVQIIGEDYFKRLVEKSSIRIDIGIHLSQIFDHANFIINHILSCKEIAIQDIWYNVSSEWWFDESYLGKDLQPLFDFFSLVEKYTLQPHTIGCGYKIESWIVTSNIREKFEQAEKLLNELLADWGAI